MGDEPAKTGTWDVFVSYAHADEAWVKTLAENLHRLGLDIFFDQWEIAPGDVLVHRLDAGLLGSRSGVLVVSPASLSRPYVQAEYAALMMRAIETGQRLIPVLLKDAEMPPLLASRVWIDFRIAEGGDYLVQVRKLADALKDTRPAKPARGSELQFSPGSGVLAAGARACRLTVRADRTTLTGDGIDVSGAPPKPDFDFDNLTWQLERARRLESSRMPDGVAAAHDDLGSVLHAIGGRLKDAFLPPEAASALAAEVAKAVALNSPLELALDVAEEFTDLPWETLRLDAGVPLALHKHVELYRRIDTGGPAAAIPPVPGPLRILVAIGSPEAQNARGELLDVEAETQRILDATEAPRRAGKAFVHILEQGTVEAISAALQARQYHVLHISCHARPGVLLLEDASGGEEPVSAAKLCDAAIPPGRQPPLVVLAGCSTGQDAGDGSGAARLPGLARALVSQGVPAVIAMQAPVGDVYATELTGSVYASLAQWDEPRPGAALADARRRLEAKRQTEKLPPPPEWATPALFTAATPQRLYDPKGTAEDLKEAPEPTFDPGVVVRRIGDMIGRRREQRLILQALRDKGGTGVLIHGIGGVGKSTLAAQILHRLADDNGFLLISVEGATDPDEVLGAFGRRLLSVAMDAGWDERHPMRQLAGVLREPKHSWRDRFDLLSDILLSRAPVAFLFDNFEDNLAKGSPTGVAPPEEFAALLARWLQAPGLSRLVFTSRHAFTLPEDTHARLAPFHLGPLSWAETRKLLWRLDGLKDLPAEEQRRAYENIGGHPRALEYLDAILRGGKAKFTDVSIRLRERLKAKNITDPGRWCADTAGGLDAALAEVVTLVADDVLLDQLLAQLADDPLARRLLIGAAVYRLPVDDLGLIWQVGEPVERVPDPERAARLQAMHDRLKEAQKKDPAVSLRTVFTPAELAQYGQDREAERRPPVSAPAGFAVARVRLMELSLLAPVRFAEDEEERFFVHRWTATALASRVSADEQSQAHRTAAAYWRWRVRERQQSREIHIENLLECRYHLHAVGDTEGTYEVSYAAISQLGTWGAWERKSRITRETLTWMPVDSRHASTLMRVLGTISYDYGEYEAATTWYLQALTIDERLGHRTGMANCFHELAIVAQRRGDYDAALDWYNKSLAIHEELGETANVAQTYIHLAIIAFERGDYDTALDWCNRSREISEQHGDDAGMAAAYGELSIVTYGMKDYKTSLEWCKKSLAIKMRRGDLEGISRSYAQMGTTTKMLGDYKAARDFYRQSLAIEERLGHTLGIAAAYNNIGALSALAGDLDDAIDWCTKALRINEEIGNIAEMAVCLSNIASMYMQKGQIAESVPFQLRKLSLQLKLKSPNVAASLLELSHQRQALGAGEFHSIVAQHLNAESMANLFRMLDDFDRQQGHEQ